MLQLCVTLKQVHIQLVFFHFLCYLHDIFLAVIIQIAQRDHHKLQACLHRSHFIPNTSASCPSRRLTPRRLQRMSVLRLFQQGRSRCRNPLRRGRGREWGEIAPPSAISWTRVQGGVTTTASRRLLRWWWGIRWGSWAISSSWTGSRWWLRRSSRSTENMSIVLIRCSKRLYQHV